MDGTQVLTLGLEVSWVLKDQHAVSPHRLDLTTEAERSSLCYIVQIFTRALYEVRKRDDTHKAAVAAAMGM